MKPEVLQALLKLADDDSSYVSKHALVQIESSMSEIQTQICSTWFSLSTYLQERLWPSYQQSIRTDVKNRWPQILSMSPLQRLENGLAILNDFGHPCQKTQFKESLDSIAGEFISTGRPIQALELVDFLFGSALFSSYHGSEAFALPIQSQFQSLLETRKGTSFSLSCLLILVGSRLGMKMKFCNFPDRILVHIPVKGTGLFVDTSNYGELMGFNRLQLLAKQCVNPQVAMQSIKKLMSSTEILDYVLKCFNTEAHQMGDDSLGRFIYELIEECKVFMQTGEIVDSTLRLFQTGEVVRHSEYDYCGIVVEFDARFQNEKFITPQKLDKRKSANSTSLYQSQEATEQPWYKILVEDGQRIAYVPQSNLLPEITEFKVEHPLLPYFFEHCPDRGYVRNGRLWPEAY